MWRSLGGDLPLARFCAAVLGARIGELWAVLHVTLADKVDAAIEAWLGREVNRAKRLFTDDGFAEAVRPEGLTLEQTAEHHRRMVAEDAERIIEALSEDRAASRLERGAEGAREIGARLAPAHAERIGALPELRLLVMRLMGEIEEARKGPWPAGDLNYRPELQPGDTDAVLKALRIERQKVAVAVVETVPDAKPIVPGRTLREAIARRIVSYRRDNKPTERMVNQTASRLQILADALGEDRVVMRLTRDDLRPIVEALQDLPVGWRTRAELGNGSIFERARRARELELTALEPATVKAHLAVWRSLFEDEGVVPSPVADFKIRARRKRVGQKRDGFTDQEVGTIFASALFQGALSKDRPYDPSVGTAPHLVSTWHFWACLIACFTGARISEIAQLRPADVISHVEHGKRVWALRITEEAEDGEDERRLKNAASERVVPMHAELARIGLLQLAEQQKAAGAATLLPDCPKPVGGDAGKQLSKWMSERFVKRLGIKREGMGFHFFRHTLTTWLRAAEVPKDARKMLAGRSLDDGDGDSDDGYGTWTLTTLRDHLHKIAVPDEIRKIVPRHPGQDQGGGKAPVESSRGA